MSSTKPSQNTSCDAAQSGTSRSDGTRWSSLEEQARAVVAKLVDSKPIPASCRRELLTMLRYIETGERMHDSTGCTWTLGACLDEGLCVPYGWVLTDLGRAVARLLTEGTVVK